MSKVARLTPVAPTSGAPRGRVDRPDRKQVSSISAWRPAYRVFGFLLAFRIANALSIKTFFQPDEYFQSLEPAWQLAFGRESRAWITWEWRSQLRSSLHPFLFAAVYHAATQLAWLLDLDTATRADLLIAAPKVCQAVIAAAADYFTWRLAQLIYGRNHRAAWASLILTTISPWQWFCSTRTLSNSLETTLTAATLSLWPWQWVQSGLPYLEADHRSQSSTGEHAGGLVGIRNGSSTYKTRERGYCWDLRISLLLAATACILRPTNVLIWFCLCLHATISARAWGGLLFLAREGLICGFAIVGVASIADRVYYGDWTLPPLRFLYFNLAKSLAVFYGRNRPDYYLTEGLPLLLTTALPFAAAGLWHALRPGTSFTSPTARDRTKAKAKDDNGDEDVLQREPISAEGGQASTSTLRLFACTVIFVTLTMSLIAHKEVRFLFPLLPIFHVLAGPPVVAVFFGTSPSWRLIPSRTPLLAALVTVNIIIAVYTSGYHQRGVIDVLHHLRHTHEAELANSQTNVTTTVGFLMPCHSTPWRSHLVHPTIHSWALTCEPPLDVPLGERSLYMDEADLFYEDPIAWLRLNMRRFPTSKGNVNGPDEVIESRIRRRNRPDRLVFFQQLEQTMMLVAAHEGLGGPGYSECWRGFNTHWHDDWRRQGDVVVWCRTDLDRD